MYYIVYYVLYSDQPFHKQYESLLPYLVHLGLYSWFAPTSTMPCSNSGIGSSSGDSSSCGAVDGEESTNKPPYTALIPLVMQWISEYKSCIPSYEDQYLAELSLLYRTEIIGVQPTESEFSVHNANTLRLYTERSCAYSAYLAVGLTSLAHPLKPPCLLSLPSSYTTLHAMVTALCSYTNPAVCLTCGVIMEIGPVRGVVCEHVIKCSGGSGLVFLVQVCECVRIYVYVQHLRCVLYFVFK